MIYKRFQPENNYMHAYNKVMLGIAQQIPIFPRNSQYFPRLPCISHYAFLATLTNMFSKFQYAVS